MTPRSHYDELHDRYHAILTTKAGTRYERLAALVFKTLEERNVVVHDLKLLARIMRQVRKTVRKPSLAWDFHIRYDSRAQKGLLSEV